MKIRKETIVQITVSVFVVVFFAFIISDCFIHDNKEKKGQISSQIHSVSADLPGTAPVREKDSASQEGIALPVVSAPVISQAPAKSPSVSSNITAQKSIVSSKAPPVNTPSKPSAVVNSTVPDEAQNKARFQSLYKTAELKYKADISNQLSSCRNQLYDLQDRQNELTVAKITQPRWLSEQYANMGLLDSGQFRSALNGLNASYDRQIRSYQTQIASLNEKIEELEAESQNPDPNAVLAIVAVDNGLTAQQVLDNYNKYILN